VIAQILIQSDASGSISLKVQAEVDDKARLLGMLEMAKALLLSQMQAAENRVQPVPAAALAAIHGNGRKQ
jgi:hypothetical protein